MKKIEKGHKVIPEGTESNPAEDLISEQNDISAEYEFGEDESEQPEEPGQDAEEDKQKQTEKKEPKKPAKGSFCVKLVGAASYAGCGMRFYKGESTEVCEEVYKKLLSTKLFVSA